jgi:hypothetical protein
VRGRVVIVDGAIVIKEGAVVDDLRTRVFAWLDETSVGVDWAVACNPPARRQAWAWIFIPRSVAKVLSQYRHLYRPSAPCATGTGREEYDELFEEVVVDVEELGDLTCIGGEEEAKSARKEG